MSDIQSLKRPRRTWLRTLIVLFVLGGGYTILAGLWTDSLWFSHLGYRQVFVTRLSTEVALFVIFGGMLGLAVAGTIVLASRLAQSAGPSSSALLNRYRAALGQRLWLMALAPAMILGLMAGGRAVAATPVYQAYHHQTRFGVVEPHFGYDISFFVFTYPWLRFVSSYLLTGIGICVVCALVVHFALGMLTPGNGQSRRTVRKAHAQISVLLGLWLVVFGVENLLDRYGLTLSSSSGLLDGMSYTDDHSRLTSAMVVAVIAFITAGLFFWNAVRPRWNLPIAAVVLMVVSSLIVGLAYPAVVQSFDVRPDEPDKERPYIERHIAATRQAYGISDLQIYDYSATTTANPGQLKADAAALPGIRLIDPTLSRDTFEQLQQVRGYLSVAPVLDVDRYTIDGQETDVVIAAREMDHSGLPNKEWNNLHTVYTHGYGVVASYGNRRQVSGEPDWLAKDIPQTGRLTVAEPRIYYGEQQTAFAVVGRPEGAPPIEFDTPGATGGEHQSTYAGKGGVPIGNFGNRLLYATRFADVNLLLSDRVNSESRILYQRTPRERVRQVAPWLTPDSDIYPALVGGRIVWIVDAYTTTAHYPNSRNTSLRNAITDAINTGQTIGTDTTINYMRNSVKATVDAYDGTVTLYAWDEQDPLLQTWMKVYPGTVQPASQISAELREHLRYPEDLFKVQRDVIHRYHTTDPAKWFDQSDLWAIPLSPTADKRREPTYFVSIKWPAAKLNGVDTPAETKAQFSQTAVFTPVNRENLAAQLVVVADAASPDYGKLRVLRMSDSTQISGPNQAYNAIVASERVAAAVLPYKQSSAQVLYGNLLTIPLGGGVMYVEPIYTKRENAQGSGTAAAGSFPVLTFVVVRFGETVGIGTTLQEALDQAFAGNSGVNTGEQPGPTTQQPSPPTGKVDQPALQQALSDAQKAFAAADAALKNGDLAAYQKAMGEARAAVERAATASGR